MKHWAVLLLCLLSVSLSFGQTPVGGNSTQSGSERLNLLHSLHGKMNNKLGLMVYYQGVYEHKGNTLAADSSYIYEDENKNQFFEAFGNVIITQPSGTVIYSDHLHYDALAQHARLTGNVRMIDANSVLTTNYMTYNMRSKTGTYRSGGRIVSSGDTITSKNAYYFENTADAYFRYDVVVRTPNVKVYTDSMRYNSISKETYFFGPTNMKGNKGENFYTERGTYNTGTGIAKFNLNNLYTEGSKFLKGDSLYYNRDVGVGEAYRNVVFVDTLDKFYAHGGKGLYRQEDESILMTEKPYIIMVIKNDSTENRSPADSVQVDMKIVEEEQQWKEIQEASEDAEEGAVQMEKDSLAMSALTDIAYKGERDTVSNASGVDSVYMTADTLFSRVILLKDYNPLQLNLSRDGGKLIADEGEDFGDDEDDNSEGESVEQNLGPDNKESVEKQGQLLEGVGLVDSTELSIDSIPKIDTKSDPDKKEEIAEEQGQLLEKVDLVDSTKLSIDSIPKIDAKLDLDTANISEKKIEKKVLSLSKKQENLSIGATLAADSVLRQQAEIPVGNEADTKINEALKVAKTPDTTQNKVDMSVLDSTKTVSDTAKTRIVRAHYNVRLFKSDLQAVADSAYYGMADSMFRFMGKPMIWAEDSQISADTVYMQIVNQQLDNALLKGNAFMVNAVLDSVKFNQLKGRTITAFFANNNIEKLFVDGNAENISFSVNEQTKIITEMFHDRGARIKVKMENKEIIDYTTIRNVDQKVYPLSLVNQENEILKGFVWRPQDRPTSKEDLLNRKRELDRDTLSAKDSAQIDSVAGGEGGRPVVSPKDDDLEKLDEGEENSSESNSQQGAKSEAMTEEEAAEMQEEEKEVEEKGETADDEVEKEQAEEKEEEKDESASYPRPVSEIV